MARLVVTYQTAGSFECGSCDIVLCFEYESAEAWLVHFDDAVKDLVRARRAWKAEYDKWSRSRPHVPPGTRDPRKLQAYDDWGERNPGPAPPDRFTFGGVEFALEDFYHYDSDTFDLPAVLELEAWFAANANYPAAVPAA